MRRAPALAAAGMVAVAAAALSVPAALAGQERAEQPRVTAAWSGASIAEVGQAFADFGGRSIVLGADVRGTVTATIRDQPWDEALRAILLAQGLVGIEDDAGIIRVERIEALHAATEVEPLLTRPYALRHQRAAELAPALQPLLSARGRMTVAAAANAVIVTDVARVHEAFAALLR